MSFQPRAGISEGVLAMRPRPSSDVWPAELFFGFIGNATDRCGRKPAATKAAVRATAQRGVRAVAPRRFLRSNRRILRGPGLSSLFQFGFIRGHQSGAFGLHVAFGSFLLVLRHVCLRVLVRLLRYLILRRIERALACLFCGFVLLGGEVLRARLDAIAALSHQPVLGFALGKESADDSSHRKPESSEDHWLFAAEIKEGAA